MALCLVQSSYGKLQVNSVVHKWIDVPEKEAYYAAGKSGFTSKLHEAVLYSLEQVDRDTNFNEFDLDGDGQIDGITFLHSGTC